MGISINQQLMSFVVSVLCGAMTGLFFDVFRCARKMIHMNDIVVNICDGLFFLVSGFFAFFTILSVNNGELRWYLFAGILCGGVLYFLLLSKWFMKAFVFLLKVLFKVVYYFLLPFMAVLKWFRKLLRKIGLRLKIPFERIKRRIAIFCKGIKTAKTKQKQHAKKKGKKPKKS